MILDLQGYDSFPVKARLTADSADISMFSADQLRVESLTLEVDIYESSGEYFCRGRMVALAKVECARCLTFYPVELEYESGFTVCGHGTDKRDDTKGSVDDTEYLFFTGGDMIVDVTDQVRQSVLLAMPMHPLCTENCKGLCSSCGANLNDGDCRCSHDRIDSHWDGLKSLKDLR